MPISSHESISTSQIRTLDAIPDPVFVMDRETHVLAYNEAAQEIPRDAATLGLGLKGGETLHCMNAVTAPGGCGTGPDCVGCTVRNSVRKASEGVRIKDRVHCMERMRGGKKVQVTLAVSAAPVDWQGRSQVLLIIKDITELVSLRQIVPICMCCRKVRNDADYWQSVEEYFRQKMDIDFSHGICPECLEAYYQRETRTLAAPRVNTA